MFVSEIAVFQHLHHYAKSEKTFTIPNLKKREITLDFNGNLGHICGVITH